MLIQYEQTLTRVFHKISHLKYFINVPGLSWRGNIAVGTRDDVGTSAKLPVMKILERNNRKTSSKIKQRERRGIERTEEKTRNWL